MLIVAYLIVLVLLVHAAIAFLLRDNLTRILHDDLIRFKTAVRANTIASVLGLDDFHTNSEFAASLRPLLQSRKSAVLAQVRTNIAVGLITLIQHDAILAALTTAIFGRANALGLIIFEMRRLLPVSSSIANKSI